MVEVQENKTREPGGAILVIEDSPTQAAYLNDILESGGYRVIVAGSGREALAMIPAARPSLIISDVIMPGLDGYELSHSVRALGECGNVPIILLTALSDPHDVVRALECGADAFITKPYGDELLLSRIGYLLTNPRPHAGAAAQPALEITFAGQRYEITAGRRQIIDLLLSTYETAIQKNNELGRARDDLNSLNKRLEAANRELEAFNYTVSHDLRTPLTNISGYSQLLLELYATPLGEAGTEYVQEIYQTTLRMNALINDLMRFARLYDQELKREEINLSTMALAIATELRMGAPERQVDFRIEEDVRCNADPGFMQVVLANLLGNAWKYTGQREVARIEFGVADVDGRRVCYVRDNGAGFDMKDAHRLFGAFQRLHGREFEGTGIGLATVQRIIQRHGGSVWAEGEPDRGATFFFTLSPD